MKRISSLKNLFCFLMICCPFCDCFSQEIPEFGKITATDFNVQSTLIDTATQGVILFDNGTLNYVGNDYSWFSYEVTKHTRIKLINKNSFELATVKIALYEFYQKPDKISNIKATTYNLENGKVIATNLDTKDIYEEKVSSQEKIKKFTMPSLKEGSIIEFEFTVSSVRYWSLPSWRFQHINYPCLISRYEIVIPSLLNYYISKTGLNHVNYTNINLEKPIEYHLNYLVINSIANKYVWDIKNVPAFKVENYLFNPDDYLDKVQFYLIETYHANNVKTVAVNWNEMAIDLINDEFFGLKIEADRTVNLLNTANRIVGDETDPLNTCKILYNYVSNNFICEPEDGIYFEDDLYDINKKRKGSPVELNMLLIALLRQKGISADPVILSTRDYGSNSAKYPLLNRINYVICKVDINGNSLYLDATKSNIGFGKLPLKCYNGHARIINKKGGDSFFLNPDSILEKRSITVNISNDKKGAISGLCEIRPGQFQSEAFRENFPRNGTKPFFDEIKSQLLSDTKISNQGIDSLKNNDFPLVIHFEFEAAIDSTAELLYFSPVIGMTIKENPFKAEKREYPVEMDYPIDETYTLNMEIPDGYELAELPKSTRVKLNDTEGAFQYLITQSGNDISLQCRTMINKAIFYPNDYQTLRDFYSFVVKKLEEQIVFKKKNKV